MSYSALARLLSRVGAVDRDTQNKGLLLAPVLSSPSPPIFLCSALICRNYEEDSNDGNQ